MLNFMYHFVGRDENLKGISLEKFRLQLNFLQKKYSHEEVVLTFDHGTIDHLENVAPELERRDMKGVFFILTMIPEKHNVPLVDKQRFLEASYRTKLAKMMCAELGIDYHPEVAEGYQPAFGFYSAEERYLRYLRDKIVSVEVYGSFIGKYFKRIFGDEDAFVSREYLSWNQIAELHKRGHIIGTHSHAHYGDRDDYAHSIKLIENRVDAKVEYVSYPNGIKRISDEDLIALGIKKAYISTEMGTDPYRVGRIDCSQADLHFEKLGWSSESESHSASTRH